MAATGSADARIEAFPCFHIIEGQRIEHIGKHGSEQGVEEHENSVFRRVQRARTCPMEFQSAKGRELPQSKMQ